MRGELQARIEEAQPQDRAALAGHLSAGKARRKFHRQHLLQGSEPLHDACCFGFRWEDLAARPRGRHPA